MKNPYYTFISPDNYYANPDDINPQLLSESLKSFRSEAAARRADGEMVDDMMMPINGKGRAAGALMAKAGVPSGSSASRGGMLQHNSMTKSRYDIIIRTDPSPPFFNVNPFFLSNHPPFNCRVCACTTTVARLSVITSTN